MPFHYPYQRGFPKSNSQTHLRLYISESPAGTVFHIHTKHALWKNSIGWYRLLSKTYHSLKYQITIKPKRTLHFYVYLVRKNKSTTSITVVWVYFHVEVFLRVSVYWTHMNLFSSSPQTTPIGFIHKTWEEDSYKEF